MNGTPEERQERLRVLRQKKKDQESDELMNEMVRNQRQEIIAEIKEEIIEENEQSKLDWKNHNKQLMRNAVTRFTGQEKKDDEREPIKRRKIIKEIVIVDDNKEVVITDNIDNAYIRIEFG